MTDLSALMRNGYGIAQIPAIPEEDLIPISPMEVETDSIVIKRYYDRMVRQNKNWLGIMTGPTGSGKSYSALSLAETLDPSFTIDRIVFSPQDFMRIFDDDKIKKGQMVIWEEAGVTIGARDFQTKVNKAINYFIQSFRSKNTGVIFTLPSMMMLDAQVRNLAHTLMQPVSIDKENKLAIIRLYEIQHNPLTGETYQKYIRAVVNGGVYKVNRVAVRIPSHELRKEYELKKESFLKQLAKDTLDKLTPESEKNGNNGMSDEQFILECAEKVLGNEQVFYGPSRRKPTVIAVATRLNVTDKMASKILLKYTELKREHTEKLYRAALLPMDDATSEQPSGS